MATVQLAQLLEAGVHFGHKANRWNPKMFPYIYSERDGIHNLIDNACKYSEENSTIKISLTDKDKIFLFVGTKRQATAIIEQEAKNCNSYYVNHRWLGGMLTNWKTLKQDIERLKKLEQQEQDGIFDLLPKKEVASTRKELEKLRMHLNGIKDMPRTPDVMIVVDQRRELTAIKEAISLNIPVISILDTNCDPDIVNIPIPGNDDSSRINQITFKHFRI